MNITTISFFPGGINDENDSDSDGKNKGSSSLVILIIVIFINQYTLHLYSYTTLSPLTLFWNKSHTLFSCSSISVTL